MLAGTTLRFVVSRQGALDGLPAFRLPPNIRRSNLYAHMVVSAANGAAAVVHASTVG